MCFYRRCIFDPPPSPRPISFLHTARTCTWSDIKFFLVPLPLPHSFPQFPPSPSPPNTTTELLCIEHSGTRPWKPNFNSSNPPQTALEPRTTARLPCTLLYTNQPLFQDGTVFSKQEPPGAALGLAVDDGFLHVCRSPGTNALHGHDPLNECTRYQGHWCYWSR